MKTSLFNSRRSLSFILSVCLIFSGFSLREALAEGEMVNSVSGSGGSISIFLTDDKGKPISSAIHAGDVVCPKASAHTPSGGTIPCARPNFGKIDGFTGNQLSDLNPNGCFVAGQNMGSAEITVSCDELPNVQGKMEVSNVGGLMTPADKATASKAAAEQAAASGAANPALVVLGVGAVTVGTIVLVKALMGPCPAGEVQCGSSSHCCSGGQYYVNNRCQTCPQANNSCYGSPSPGYLSCH